MEEKDLNESIDSVKDVDELKAWLLNEFREALLRLAVCFGIYLGFTTPYRIVYEDDEETMKAIEEGDKSMKKILDIYSKALILLLKRIVELSEEKENVKG